MLRSLGVCFPNDASTVLRLVMGDVSFLLTSDIEADGEAALVRSGTELRATVLKVAHHGSSTSTTATCGWRRTASGCG